MYRTILLVAAVLAVVAAVAFGLRGTGAPAPTATPTPTATPVVTPAPVATPTSVPTPRRPRRRSRALRPMAARSTATFASTWRPRPRTA